MAHDAGPALGMSVGSTNLVGVTADRTVIRSPVLTLYQNHPSRVGLPEELTEKQQGPPTEAGQSVTDFVDRVGDADPIVMADGSARPAAQLLAEALHALASLAAGDDQLPPAVAVAHPAHWSHDAVQALRDALGLSPLWSERPVSLITDVTAALTALQAKPGLPDSGVIAVCDFGGRGTGITLVDAGDNYRPIGVTVRHAGFAGQLIDRLLSDHVVAELDANGSTSGAPAIGSLTRLRSQCSSVKEQLSVHTVAELPGFHGGVWITRAELDEAIRQPLEGFFAVLQQVLDDNRVRQSDLAAVVSVGGVAGIPMINTGLTERFNTAVIGTPRAHLTAAIGAALWVADGAATTAAPWVLTPQSPGPVIAEPERAVDAGQPLMQPQISPPVQSIPSQPISSQPSPPPVELAVDSPPSTETDASPTRDADDARTDRTSAGWFRRPVPVILGAALAALLIGAVAVIALRHAADRQPEAPLPSRVPSTTTGSSAPATPMPQPIPSPEPIVSEIPTLPYNPEEIPSLSPTSEPAATP